MGHVEEVGASSRPSIYANSPNATIISALAARLSKSPLPTVDVSSFLLQHHCRTWNWPPTKKFHSPLANLKPFTEFLFRDQPTPRRPMQQHPWDQKEELPPSFLANNVLTRRFFQSQPEGIPEWPFQTVATLFITEARCFNLSVKFQSSTRRNALLRAAGRGN